MPVEDNKQAARRFYEEVINARNVDALGELLTPDGVDHTFGSHQGEFVGIPATGRKTTTSGVDWFRMEGGKQAEHWGGPDMLSFLVQLGVMPGPGTPGPGTPA
jgi:predicted SnoaL-like aldol condensation-catalyzing enzyme